MNEGDYWGVLRQASVGVSKTNKTPQMVMVFSVTHEATGEGWKEIQQADRTIYWALTDKALPYAEEKLRFLGFNGDYGNPQFGEKSQGCSLRCKHEDYKGNTQERWDLAEWGGAGAEKAGDDVIRLLNAQWKSHNGSQPKPAGKPKPPAPPAKTPVAQEVAPDGEPVPKGDNIPF